MLQAQNETLETWLDDLKVQNIKIGGIPEGSENACPMEFIISLLSELFGDDSFANNHSGQSSQVIGP